MPHIQTSELARVAQLSWVLVTTQVPAPPPRPPARSSVGTVQASTATFAGKSKNKPGSCRHRLALH